MRGRVLLALALAAPALLAAGTVQHRTIAGRDVAVWMPSGNAPAAGFPVVLFSHGFSGCNTQSVFLMEALSRAGYLVLAPNHKDARCGSARGASTGELRPEEPFTNPEQWSDSVYRDRADDMRAVLDAVLRGRSFEGIRADAARIGLAGHSLGGYTVLGLGGAWPSWKDPRIKAVLALSPYTNPFLARGSLGSLNVPVMFQTGTLDLGIQPSVKRSSGAYDLSSTPKYFLELKGAGHFAWTNLNPRFQDAIDEYSVAFFDRYLKKTMPDPLEKLDAKGKLVREWKFMVR
jgi:predicted dienelactone hydrolase